MYRSLMLIVCSLLFLSQLFAQRTIVGTVTDCEGEWLAGATIEIKGAAIGVTADENGFYRIEIPKALDTDKRALVFSYYSTTTQKIKIKDKDTINVKLKEYSIYNNELEDVTVDKPVIYLYPEKQTDINLAVNFNGKFDFTYPPYKNGWQVTAQPDGTLTDKNDGLEHKYLFWDGVMHFSDADRTYKNGFVVHKDSLVAFFRKYLPQMGLKPQEYNDFIVFWTPLLQKNEWNFIHFRTGTAYDVVSTNTVTPEPDTEIRIFMEFKKVAAPFNIPAQELLTPERKGFTLVEWGGGEMQAVQFKTAYTGFKPTGKEIQLKKQEEIRSCSGTMKPLNPEKF
ncbi:MAG: hypothetical protein EOP54_00425 [Sphingobacteriales bacterium]|nr:MAG: hypothetical protein EOP54_00425 [Sphingobacteriales bacterium]